MKRRYFLAALGAALGLVGTALHGPAQAADQFIIVQSTTSTQNSGLLDYILPKFT